MFVESTRFAQRFLFSLILSVFLAVFLTRPAIGEDVFVEKDFTAGVNECNTVTIGTGTSTWEFPINTYTRKSRTQVIYLANEINRPGTIMGLALDVETMPGQDLNDWTIRMKHTPLNSYMSAGFETTGWTIVYEANESIASTGWWMFNFSRPFRYNGVDNLMVDFSYDNSNFSSNGRCRVSTPGGIRSAYASTDNSFYGDPLDWSGTTLPTVYGSGNVPNVRLMFCSVLGVDFNSDGIPNFCDFSYFSGAWKDANCSDPDWCGGRDLNRDGIVDIDDLRTFDFFWLWPAADLDMDGVVRMQDLGGLGEFWKSEDCANMHWCYGCDFDKSGMVDIFDMAKLAEFWLRYEEWY